MSDAVGFSLGSSDFPPLPNRNPGVHHDWPRDAGQQDGIDIVRRGYPNPDDVCHLNATLHALWALPGVTAQLGHLACATNCPSSCMWHALSTADIACRRDSPQAHCLHLWEPLFRKWDLHVHEQQDAVEDFEHILNEAPDHFRNLFLQARGSFQTRTFQCSCIQDIESSQHAQTCHVNLPVPATPTPLTQLLEELTQWGPVMESHCEHCQMPGTFQQRTEHAPMGTALVVGLRRYVQFGSIKTGCKRLRLPNVRTPVEPAEVIDHQGIAWTLRSIIVHQGHTRRSGHYVAYVQENSQWIMYNDQSRVLCQSLPLEVSTDGVLFAYARVSDSDRQDTQDPATEDMTDLMSLNGESQMSDTVDTTEKAHDTDLVHLKRDIADDDSTDAMDINTSDDSAVDACDSDAELLALPLPNKASAQPQPLHSDWTPTPCAAMLPSQDAPLPPPAQPPADHTQLPHQGKPTILHPAASAGNMPQVAPSVPADNSRFMMDTAGHCALQLHVQELLDTYDKAASREKEKDCRAFLLKLPLFRPGGDITQLPDELDTACRMYTQDCVTSAAALQVRPCVADTMAYSLCVLMTASAQSCGIPPIFFIDVLHTLLNSVFHKSFHVKLGRWKSKNRHWMAATANVGEGKSPGLKAFIALIIEVLSELPDRAVGVESDRYHYQQGSTSAAAIDKLRACLAYLTMYSPDATRVLCPAAASGGHTDPHKYVDLELFLDAAHGEEFEQTTKLDRQQQQAKVKQLQNPLAPQEEIAGLHMDPTNVHILFLQQDVLFTTWWARQAATKSVGIAQRFLFAFGGDADAAPIRHKDFMTTVTLPIVKDLLKLIVRFVGPRLQSGADPFLECTPEQDIVFSQLEEVLTLHKRRHNVPESFKASLPKTCYWIGTACLTNGTLASLWHPALQGVQDPAIETTVTEDTFSASVRFA